MVTLPLWVFRPFIFNAVLVKLDFTGFGYDFFLPHAVCILLLRGFWHKALIFVMERILSNLSRLAQLSQ